MLNRCSLAIIALALSAAAYAEPPPGTDLTSPVSRWFQSLQAPNNGPLCCSEADCRSVQYRIKGDHFEVFIDRKSFGQWAPDDWLPVPKSAILRRHDNPIGEAIACYWGGEVKCFVEAAGA